MNRDHQANPYRHGAKHHERKEWNELGDDRHTIDGGGRDRSSWKTHRRFGARSEEAAAQIRELRTRY
jgi:hypothetical protein